MPHTEGLAALFLLAAALLAIGWGLHLVYAWATTVTPTAVPLGSALIADEPEDWDETALLDLRDTGPPGRGLAGYLAQIDLQEALERRAETSEISIVRALVAGADFRDGIDRRAELALEHCYALLTAADIGIDLASVGTALA